MAKLTVSGILRTLIRALLPLLLLLVGGWLAYKIFNASSPAGRGKRPNVTAQVEVQDLARQDFRIQLSTQGSVQASIRTLLRAEATGRIVAVASAFREGGRFAKGELLFQIDPRDAELAIKRAEGELKAAQDSLAALEVEVGELDPQMELARRELELQGQRIERGQNLIEKGVRAEETLEALKLAEVTTQTRLQTLRSRKNLLIAQRRSTEGQVTIARMVLEQARINLTRTRVEAPYEGEVLTQSADLGQWVSPGTELAVVFSADTAEVRLPLSSRQQAAFVLPAEASDGDGGAGADLELRPVSGQEVAWPARIARVESAIDSATRQLFVVAEVARPFEVGPEGQPPLRLGTFVEASIPGRMLRDVYVVPRGALRTNNILFLVAGQTLRRQPVEPLWTDDEVAVVRGGIREGDALCLTPLVFGGQEIPVRAVRPGAEAPQRERKPAPAAGEAPR